MSAPNPYVNTDQAVKALQSGELVAIPTETVYGLAAAIDNPLALQQIFKLKERPLYDPLIVHISDLTMLESLVVNIKHYPALMTLAKHFWPGPLTLVFQKNQSTVSDLITSGQDTVAIRIPQHPVTLELIKKLGVAVAAPSANPFKKTSPTSAKLVGQYFPDLKILDGGHSQVGIESTIIRQIESHSVEILRPGMITPEDIKRIPGWNYEIKMNLNTQGPGSMLEHYQPLKPLFLIKGNDISSEQALKLLQMNMEVSFLQKLNLHKRLHALKINELKLDADPFISARMLYRQLMELSETSDIIFINWSLNNTQDAWLSILNRVEKAATKIIFAPPEFTF